jgi:hypothetical protein
LKEAQRDMLGRVHETVNTDVRAILKDFSPSKGAKQEEVSESKAAMDRATAAEERAIRIEKERDEEKVTNQLMAAIASQNLNDPDMVATYLRKNLKLVNGTLVGLDKYGDAKPLSDVISEFALTRPYLKKPMNVSGTAQPGSGTKVPATGGDSDPADEVTKFNQKQFEEVSKSSPAMAKFVESLKQK